MEVLFILRVHINSTGMLQSGIHLLGLQKSSFSYLEKLFCDAAPVAENSLKKKPNKPMFCKDFHSVAGMVLLEGFWHYR